MKLALVIPVWNDLPGARGIVAQAIDLGCFDQIIISDDGSDVAFTQEDLGLPETPDSPGIEVLRSPHQTGAGQARNRGLERVSTSHVLFFDADDLLRPELADLVVALDARSAQQEPDFDFCMFRHVEHRRRKEGHEGLFAKDEDLWRAAGAVHPLSELSHEGAHRLSQVAAYPWNKIYRTAFLRDNDVASGQTVVHNDIELHWMGFVKARTILCSDILGCEHLIGEGQNHLSNRHGQDRLQIFAALETVLEQLKGTGQTEQAWQMAFAWFYIDLLGWAQARIDPEWRADFDAKAREMVMKHVDQSLFSRLNHADPYRARQVNTILGHTP